MFRSISLIALALALAVATSGVAAASPAKSERLVVRGTDTVKDSPACPGGVCKIELTDGAFRGTVGTGSYTGALDLVVAETFANGEGGVCAPIRGRIVLGAGSPNRLVLALMGDSCQDGKGDVREATFTGLAGFVVKYGTGTYAKARGYGLASFTEDAADREQMTLVGRISR